VSRVWFTQEVGPWEDWAHARRSTTVHAGIVALTTLRSGVYTRLISGIPDVSRVSSLRPFASWPKALDRAASPVMTVGEIPLPLAAANPYSRMTLPAERQVSGFASTSWRAPSAFRPRAGREPVPAGARSRAAAKSPGHSPPPTVLTAAPPPRPSASVPGVWRGADRRTHRMLGAAWNLDSGYGPGVPPSPADAEGAGPVILLSTGMKFTSPPIERRPRKAHRHLNSSTAARGRRRTAVRRPGPTTWYLLSRSSMRLGSRFIRYCLPSVDAGPGSCVLDSCRGRDGGARQTAAFAPAPASGSAPAAVAAPVS